MVNKSNCISFLKKTFLLKNISYNVFWSFLLSQFLTDLPNFILCPLPPSLLPPPLPLHTSPCLSSFCSLFSSILLPLLPSLHPFLSSPSASSPSFLYLSSPPCSHRQNCIWDQVLVFSNFKGLRGGQVWTNCFSFHCFVSLRITCFVNQNSLWPVVLTTQKLTFSSWHA